MRLIAAIALAGLLTSCASAPGVRANGPIRTYASEKTPEAVRDCIVRGDQANVAMPLGEGWMVNNIQNPNVASFAEIERAGQGSAVKVFGLELGTLYFWKQVERCV
jgi:hypothetical protein